MLNQENTQTVKPKNSGSASHHELILAVGLAGLGILTRFMPHIPNFSPVLAVIIFSVVAVRSRLLGVLFPLLTIAVSDSILGFYKGIEFVYLAYALTAISSLLISRAKPTLGVLNAGLGGTFTFFVLSNFGVWYATDMYAKTSTGLLQCYVMALPFYYQTLISTLLGLAVLFGVHATVNLWTRRLVLRRAQPNIKPTADSI